MAERIGALLHGVITKTRRRQAALQHIQRRWKTLVGKALAEHTKPIRLSRGQLVVHVRTPGDSFVLSYDRRRILDRLKALGGEDVHEVVFRAGEV